MIRIAIPIKHPITVIARRRRYLFARLLMACNQTLVVELRKPWPAEVVADDVTGVVIDTIVDVRHDCLGMLTIEVAMRRVALVGRHVVRLEVIEPQRILLETRQHSG